MKKNMISRLVFVFTRRIPNTGQAKIYFLRIHHKCIKWGF